MDQNYTFELQSSCTRTLRSEVKDERISFPDLDSLQDKEVPTTTQSSVKKRQPERAFTEDEEVGNTKTETQSPRKSPYSGQTQISLLYRDILLLENNSQRLISLFSSERKPLEKTDASYFAYDFSSCEQRLSQGFNLIYFEYNKLQSYTSTIQAFDSYFLLKRNGFKNKLIKYSELRGVYLGMNTSTYKLYTQQFGSLAVLGLESHRCITLFTPILSYSFSSFSHQQIYDIYLFFSLKIFNSSSQSALVPISKSQLSTYIVKQKLKLMAQEKFLSLKELLLLGILDTLKKLQRPHEEIKFVARILDKSFLWESKLFRICFIIKPLEVKPGETYDANIKEYLRKFYLQARGAVFFKKRVETRKKKFDWETIKKDIRKVSTLPTVKGVANTLVNAPNLYALPRSYHFPNV